ncbi:MAG: ATP-binding cassette domain-containing protein [Thermodesulfobacteriota bacterium]
MAKTEAAAKPLLSLQNAAVRIGDRILLEGTDWNIYPRQHWAVVGPNGAGKSTLVRALAGDLPIVRGRMIRGNGFKPGESVGYVSFELHRHLIEREENRDHARVFSGRIDDLPKVRELIGLADADPGLGAEMVRLLEIDTLLDRPYRVISTGEMRKALIARAVLKSPRLLILDEPFDGLDVPSRNRLSGAVHRLMRELQVILVAHRPEEILPSISHVIQLEEGRVVRQGRRDAVLKAITADLPEDEPSSGPPMPPIAEKPEKPDSDEALIEMRNTSVRYGETRVINRLDWTVKRGENWVVLGPNGAGKTTLLSLITGDNVQAYANDIRLFGRPRGSGESIWDIRGHIGLVSSELQIHYRKRLTVLETVLSGFFDSVGLYRHATENQRRTASEQLARLGLEDMADRRFDRLSYGEQRMILLARAVVKSPELLVLDEPCQGLDRRNRETVLEMIDAIGRSPNTQLIYVTHHPGEIPGCITHQLRFRKHPDGSYAAESRALHATGDRP